MFTDATNLKGHQMTENPLGEIIASARVAKDLTQQQLADAVGISRAYLTQIENGKRVPSDQTGTRLLKALGISFEALFEEHVKEQLPPEQREPIQRLIRGYELLSRYLTAEQLAEVDAAFGSLEHVSAAMHIVQGEELEPAPAGWLELAKTDKQLVQRLINRMLKDGRTKGVPNADQAQ